MPRQRLPSHHRIGVSSIILPPKQTAEFSAKEIDYILEDVPGAVMRLSHSATRNIGQWTKGYRKETPTGTAIAANGFMYSAMQVPDGDRENQLQLMNSVKNGEIRSCSVGMSVLQYAARHHGVEPNLFEISLCHDPKFEGADIFSVQASKDSNSKEIYISGDVEFSVNQEDPENLSESTSDGNYEKIFGDLFTKKDSPLSDETESEIFQSPMEESGNQVAAPVAEPTVPQEAATAAPKEEEIPLKFNASGKFEPTRVSEAIADLGLSAADVASMNPEIIKSIQSAFSKKQEALALSALQSQTELQELRKQAVASEKEYAAAQKPRIDGALAVFESINQKSPSTVKTLTVLGSKRNADTAGFYESIIASTTALKTISDEYRLEQSANKRMRSIYETNSKVLSSWANSQGLTLPPLTGLDGTVPVHVAPVAHQQQYAATPSMWDQPKVQEVRASNDSAPKSAAELAADRLAPHKNAASEAFERNLLHFIRTGQA